MQILLLYYTRFGEPGSKTKFEVLGFGCRIGDIIVRAYRTSPPNKIPM